MNTIDLHVHSTCSDGTLTPAELVTLASSIGLSAFALTDHDSTDGIAEALRSSAALPEAKRPEVIPGIEFSTEYLGSDIHIVGLDMQYQAPEFQATVASFRDDRLIRNKKMIARMAADHIDISYEEMAKAYGEQVVNRAHFAGYLVAHGYVASRKEAFASLIGEGCRYYVPRSRIRPEEAVDLIRRFDGIPILAHPLLYHYDDAGLRTLLALLRSMDCLASRSTILPIHHSRKHMSPRSPQSSVCFHLAVLIFTAIISRISRLAAVWGISRFPMSFWMH